MDRCFLPVFLSAMLSVGSVPIAFAASSEPQLNFKIYSPEPATTPSAESAPAESTPASSVNENIIPAIETGSSPSSASTTPAEAETTPMSSAPAVETTPTATEPAAPAATETVTPTATETPAPAPTEAATPATTEAAAPAMTEAAPSAATDTSTPEIRTTTAVDPPAAETTTTSSTTTTETPTPLRSETPVEAAPSKAAEADVNVAPSAESTEKSTTTTATDAPAGGDATATSGDASTEKTASNSKSLQGYIRVVPSGTKIPIIMDTAVDSETSQEGDEFTARTAEDLNIDGGVAVPAGSIIKGRIAQMNAPKHMDRSGSVALKFDTVTTPDNRQIPLVANLVAHGGVVHAKRGLKDIAIDSGTVALPLLLGLGIGALAGNSNNSTTTSTTGSTSKITKPEAAMIGAGIGLVVGVAILCAKKGKKVDVRPGDELKIELAEDLRMPMM